MSNPIKTQALPNPDVLRQNVLSKLESMSAEQLATVHDWLLQIELDHAVRELRDAVGGDEALGRIAPEAIDASIREYRRKHPCGA